MITRILAALAVLRGEASDMPRGEATRIAHQAGFIRRGSGGGIRRALNLSGMPAFNEYRCPEELACMGQNFIAGREIEWALAHRQARNAAKRRRRERRAG